MQYQIANTNIVLFGFSIKQKNQIKSKEKTGQRGKSKGERGKSKKERAGDRGRKAGIRK